jgi:hypothetical protein
VVTVVQLTSAEGGQKQTVNHVAEEVLKSDV